MDALCFFLAGACISDYTGYRIPNYLIVAMACGGGIYNVCRGTVIDGGFYLIRAILVIAFFYPIFKIGAIGAGDVKLLGVCAGYFSRDHILKFLFFSMLIAAVFSILKMVKEKNFVERFRFLGRYVSEVAHSGNWMPYHTDGRQKKSAGLCLSGPIFLSVLLHIGGIY